MAPKPRLYSSRVTPTIEIIRKELDEKHLNFKLCPHHKINDLVAIAAVLELFETTANAKESSQSISHACSNCSTFIKIQLNNPKFAVVYGYAS